jgi:hypothetical protein
MEYLVFQIGDIQYVPRNVEPDTTIYSNVVIEWLTLLRRIWEILGSTLDLGTGYREWGFFRGFPQSLHASAEIVF